MKTVSCACFNRMNYCRFPEGIADIREFVRYLNEHGHSLVELELFREETCIAPYFLEGKTAVEYWNPALMRCVTVAEITLCTEEEYTERLKMVIAEKCVHCIHYQQDVCDEDFRPFREHIDLDGWCVSFEKYP